MNIIRISVLFVLVVVSSLFVHILWDEDQQVNTGFVPVYSGDGELYLLERKAIEKGLTKEESKRLDWLLEDKKKEVDKQWKEYLHSNMSKEKLDKSN